MSTLRQWKEAEDLRLAEESAQRALNERIAGLAIHPLVRTNCDRNLREAYFYCLVYAGICDDLKIDETEERLLNIIGTALALDVDFVTEAMTYMRDVDNAAKMELFAESLGTLKGLAPVSLQHLFASEFIKVRMLHPANEPDLPADLKDIGEGIGVLLDSDLDIFKNVVKPGAGATLVDIDRASALLGDEVVKYLVVHEMGCIDDALERFRADRSTLEARQRKQEENRNTLPRRLAAIIAADDTWPVVFNPAGYQGVLDAAGIAPDNIGAFVAQSLLPYMKRACEKAKAQIKSVPIVHDCDTWKSDDDRYHGAKFEAVKEFRDLFRLAFFVDAFVDLNSIYNKYYFVGPADHDSPYYLFSANSFDKQITYLKIGAERFSRFQRESGLAGHPRALFDRLSVQWSISDEDADFYFALWDGLFSAIEDRYPFADVKWRCEIDQSKCKGCTICSRSCPANAISGTVKVPHAIDQDLCVHCGQCFSRCHFMAITKTQIDAPNPVRQPSDKAVRAAESLAQAESVSEISQKYAAMAGQRQSISRPVIDANKCKGCTMCARACPANAISGEVKEPHVIDQDLCVNCGVCVTRCHFDAICMERR